MKPPAALHTITASELKTLEIPPQRWLIPDVIGYGLWMLAAPPKSGKSWMVLSFLLSIASGGLAFGKVPVDREGVLYLALEDTRQRLKARLERLQTDITGWPTGFHMATEAPPLDRGFTDSLRAWLEQHPNTHVMAIDTLARIRGPRIKNEDLYAGDNRIISDLQALANEFDLAMLLVHHTRKMQGTDIFDMISGTYGLTGPLDGMLVLERTRGDADATLHITGRDVQDRELALEFNAHTGLWTILGDATHWQLSRERRSILQALTDAGAPLTPKQITDATGLKHDSTRHLVIRMRNEGTLASDDKGHYTIVRNVHTPAEDATQTEQTTVNSPATARSLPFTPNDTVNAVNGSDARETGQH